ncbi:uncharacterized protein B0H18DRAFT_987962, partial [Fomitopsis serialis]|uniref:uncharacterized protein n=1 Tax=Fomitopsis serialis TaxID=139415 RepID=UPI00200758F3
MRGPPRLGPPSRPPPLGAQTVGRGPAQPWAVRVRDRITRLSPRAPPAFSFSICTDPHRARLHPPAPLHGDNGCHPRRGPRPEKLPPRRSQRPGPYVPPAAIHALDRHPYAAPLGPSPKGVTHRPIPASCARSPAEGTGRELEAWLGEGSRDFLSPWVDRGASVSTYVLLRSVCAPARADGRQAARKPDGRLTGTEERGRRAPGHAHEAGDRGVPYALYVVQVPDERAELHGLRGGARA